MAPSDSKDNNLGATSFSWIVSTCINQANWSQKRSPTEKIQNSWPNMALVPKQEYIVKLQKLPGMRRATSSETRFDDRCIVSSNIAGWVWNVWNMCRPWEVFSTWLFLVSSQLRFQIHRSTLWEVSVLNNLNRLISWDCHDHVHSSKCWNTPKMRNVFSFAWMCLHLGVSGCQLATGCMSGQFLRQRSWWCKESPKAWHGTDMRNLSWFSKVGHLFQSEVVQQRDWLGKQKYT